MTFRYSPDKDSEDFDELLWEKYIELVPQGYDEEYSTFVKENVSGVLYVNTVGAGSVIEYIDFHSEQYYTMFLLRWT